MEPDLVNKMLLCAQFCALGSHLTCVCTSAGYMKVHMGHLTSSALDTSPACRCLMHGSSESGAAPAVAATSHGPSLAAAALVGHEPARMEASPVLLTCLAVPALPLWHPIANAERSTPDHTMTQRHTWHACTPCRSAPSVRA
jgi:hypothetical protein